MGRIHLGGDDVTITTPGYKKQLLQIIYNMDLLLTD